MSESEKLNSQGSGSAVSGQSQKVEVVVSNPSDGEVNILGELSVFVLRIGFSIL